MSRRRWPAWRGIYGSAEMEPNSRVRIKLFPAERDLIGWMCEVPADVAEQIKEQVLGDAERRMSA